MPIVRAIVTLPMDSGLPEDAAQNVWHFNAATDSTAEADDIAAALKAFYDGIDSFLSTTINAAATTVTFYDLSDPVPRVPYHEVNIGQDMITGTTALPDEVALVMSFHAAPLSGVAPARRRGRVFIGPLAQAAAGAGAAGNRPAAAFITAVDNAGTALKVESDNSVWAWAVYSRVLNTAADVVNGWVDDAFDTQRRRGVQPLARTLFFT